MTNNQSQKYLREEYEHTWDTLMGSWFPESGYQPNDKPRFDLHQNDPNEPPREINFVDIYVPVKPL